MNKEIQSPRRLRTAAAGAALTALVGLLFVPWPLGRGLASLSFDLPFGWLPKRPVQGVMIVYMDQASADKYNQPWGEAVWGRDLHARLLNRLKDCRAKAVVFDIHFARTSSNDETLVRAMHEARLAGTTVIIGGVAVPSVTPSGLVRTNLDRPTPELENAASGWGLAEWHPLRRHFRGAEGVPSLGLRTAELILPRQPPSLPAERWINFYGPPGWLPNCNYARALDPLTEATNFADKVCFVGAWTTTSYPGGTRVDESDTPYTRWGEGKMPGTELTATVYLNLARGDWLTRLSVWAETCLVLITGLLLGFGLSCCRPTMAAGAGLAAAVAVTALASSYVWYQHVWFSWLIIAVVQVPVAVVWSALAYTRQLTRKATMAEHEPATRLDSYRSPADNSTIVVNPDVQASQWVPDIPEHTLLRCVGRGAYGEVWLARNAIGTYHAVKIVRRDRFDHADPYEREFRGLQRFMPISRSHPGLVAILQVGRRDAEGFIYYVMEAADDETTAERISPDTYSPRTLAKEIRRRGHLPAAGCQKIGLDLAAALEFLHQQQLIHRDIKPANIIFVKGVPKFADIGLVTDIAGTGGVSYLGTKGYIAPEGPGTPAADLYSLGKLLYEMSTGLGCELFPELPSTLFQRTDHVEMLSLNAVILQACRQDPSQRYQSAAEMREALLRCRAQRGA